MQKGGVVLSKLVDLVGQSFGYWTVESRTQNTKHGAAQWNCRCKCGTTRIITTSTLNSGRSLSCGCLNSKRSLVGRTYGSLTVIEFAGYLHSNPIWKCKCDCGAEITIYENRLNRNANINCGAPVHDKRIGQKYGRLTIVQPSLSQGSKKTYLCECECGNAILVCISNLISGNTKSCGCLSKEITSNRNTIHGLSNTRIYNTWCKMIARCEKPYETSYKRYGAKGISVCEEWHDFLTFYNWAIANGYDDTLSIDRIDSKKNYCPENCRWATTIQQARNVSSNVIVEHDGEAHSLSEWAEIYSIPYKVLHQRYRVYKWDFERALNTPIKNKEGK